MKIDKIKEDYDSYSNKADIFRRVLVEQIEKILSLKGLTLGVPVESRVKTLSSILNKDKRKPSNYNTLLELDDFVGVRLVFLFKRDLINAMECLTNSFVILKSEDKSESLDADRFGYQSHHYIVKIPDEWLTVPTFSGFDDFKAEIQVRTLSQHIWATTSHKLQYKKEHDVPLPLRRAINRVSALLEFVDLEFERVLIERESYVDKINESQGIRHEALLNVDLLKIIALQELPLECQDEGHEDFDDLMDELIENGVTTVGSLLDSLHKGLPDTLEESKRLARSSLKSYEEDDFYDDEDEREVPRWKKGVYYSHVGLIRISMVKAIEGYKIKTLDDDWD